MFFQLKDGNLICPSKTYKIRLLGFTWPRPEFRLEAPKISFINLPGSGPNLRRRFA